MRQATLVLVILAAIAVTGALAQETIREGMAIEFPEYSTGRVTGVKSAIPHANVSIVHFWLLNPSAEAVEWDKIRVRINGQSANLACSQRPANDGKLLKCDLNRYFRLRLKPTDNYLEIEAATKTGVRFYAGFNVATDGAAYARQLREKGQTAPPPAAMGSSGRKFAVILGVSKYRYNDVGLGNLEYADADASALTRWFVNTGGFDPQNVISLTNSDVTLSSVRDSLVRFLTRATETDLILFYFAGHGTPDPFDSSQLYYLVHDSKVANLRESGFPMTELKSIIDRNLRSKRAIFLLDTCHSAGLNGKSIVGFSRPVSGSRSVGADAFDERQLQQVTVKNDVSQTAGRLFGSTTGRAVLTSSDVGESSRESSRWGGGHGVFTWALLEGLGGKADTNNNRVITAQELFDFTRDYVRTATGGKQNPRLFSNLGGDLEIAVIK